MTGRIFLALPLVALLAFPAAYAQEEREGIVTEVSVTIPPLLAGDGARVPIPGMELTSLTVSAAQTTDGGKVTIRKLALRPGEAPPPVKDGRAFHELAYFDIGTKIPPADIESVRFEFQVDKDRLKRSLVNASTVMLLRWLPGADDWEWPPTDRVGESGESVRFAATERGFSIFAIVGKEEPAGSSPRQPGFGATVALAALAGAAALYWRRPVA